MTTRNVSTYGELLDELFASSDGDEIVCAAANYGDLNLYARSFSGGNPLVIRGSDTRTYGVNPGASFGTITCHGGTSGITFRNLNIYIIYVDGAYLTVEQSRVYGSCQCTSSTNLTVRQNEFPSSGVFMSNSANFLVEENFFYSKAGDMMNISGPSSYGSFLNNAGYDIRTTTPVVDPHWDFLQSFSSGGSPASLYVRGNLFIDNPATPIEKSPSGTGESEGILLGDEFNTLTAEQNLIWCQNANGLTVANPDGGGFNNNTVFGGGTIVIYTDSPYGKTYNFPVNNNIATAGHDDGGGPAPTFSGNVAPATGLISTTNTLDWTMFENDAGYTDKGAYTRYQEIVAGTNAEAIAMGAALVGWTEPGGGSTPEAPTIPGTPTISGTEAVNQILTATPSTPVTGYPTPTRTWQWYNSVSGAISGATSQTYQLQASDEGDTVYVIQTETNTEGNDTAQSSNTGTIAAAPTAPTVSSFSPADNATGVAVDAILTITFDTTMALGTGTINLWRPDQGIVDTWNVVDNAGTGEHTVHADGNDIILQGWDIWPMHQAVTYSILIDDGALESAAGVAFPGISDTTTWNFTTVGDTPLPLSLGNGAVLHLNGSVLLI